MNKKILITVIILAAILTILIAAGIFSNSNTTNQPSPESSSSSRSSSSQTSTTTSTSTEKGTYTNYSASELSAAAGKKKVLFFYADWCPSCRQQDANLTAAQNEIPANVAIFKLDYDNEIALRQKYGVTLQHTFVEVDDEGNELQQWNSLYQQNDLQGILDKVN